MPRLWLVTDERNDDVLDRAVLRLPRGSGVVFRHTHLDPSDRRCRFERIRRQTRRQGHRLVLSGSPRDARRWGADGAYGPPSRLMRGPQILRLVTAHSLREIGAARRARAHALVLSPVFATRSHPGAKPLGTARFRLLARHAGLPVIALGGMNRKRARRLEPFGWAAIDGLSF